MATANAAMAANAARRPVVRTAARGALGLAILGAVLLLAPAGLLDEIPGGLRNTRLRGFIPLLLLQVGSLGLIGLQWTILLRRRAPAREVRWFAVMRRYLGGSLVESLTPSAKLGGEAARIVLFRQRFGIPALRLAGAAGLHKLSMSVGLLLVLTAAAVAVPSLRDLPATAVSSLSAGTADPLLESPPGTSSGLTLPGLALVVGIVAAGVVAMAARRRVSSLAAAVLGRASQRRELALLTSIAVIVWVLYPLKVALAAYAAGVTIAPGVVIGATYGAYFLGLLPLTPGGLGLYEAGMAGIFIAAGVPAADAALVTLISRIVTFWWPLLLSAVSGAGLMLPPLGCGAERESREPREVSAHRAKARTLHDRLLGMVVWLENLAARNTAWGWIYTRLFYRDMIRREYDAAQLRRGSRVLQLGCGPFPMTAVELSRQGIRVTAVDCNPDALDSARRVLERASARGRSNEQPSQVTLQRACGLQYNYAGFDAVIVALHVCPKIEILRQILDTADTGTRIVYRNPRGLLCGAYQRVTPGDLGLTQVGRTAALPGKKELVVLQKPKDYMTAREIATAPCAACMLCDLAPKQCGVIEHAPEIPALAALGLRPGKSCSLIAAQPWGGPIICSVGGRQVALERSIAQQIGVRREIEQY